MISFVSFFVVMVVVGRVKSWLHWRYLRLVEKAFSKFKSFQEYKEHASQSTDEDVKAYGSLAFMLLVPVFVFKRIVSDHTVNGQGTEIMRAQRLLNIASALYIASICAFFFQAFN